MLAVVRNSSQWRQARVALVLLGVLLITACGGGSSDTPSSTESPEAEERAVGQAEQTAGSGTETAQEEPETVTEEREQSVAQAAAEQSAEDPSTAEEAEPAEAADEQAADPQAAGDEAEAKDAGESRGRLGDLSDEDEDQADGESADDEDAEDCALPSNAEVQVYLHERFPQLEDCFALLDVKTEGDQPLLVAAHSLGLPDFGEADWQPHVLMLLELQAGGSIVELGNLELESTPDMLFEGSLQQVLHGDPNVPELSVWQDIFDPSGPLDLWFVVNGFAGAHGSVFELASWNSVDGLTSRLQHFFQILGTAGLVRDLTGDGEPEVILETTEPYIFCYACGLRFYDRGFLRWESRDFEAIGLRVLPPGAPPDLQGPVRHAVELAQAGLWREAIEAVDAALALIPRDLIMRWNHMLIHDLGEGRLGEAAAEYSPSRCSATPSPGSGTPPWTCFVTTPSGT